MNYGETLAYWYLRLHGFFPLRNFVHHAPEDRTTRGDCDLIAVRFPHVNETIGTPSGDRETKRLQEWKLTPDLPIALVVQVKTGEDADHGAAFDSPRVKEALERTGLWQAERITQLVGDLASCSRAVSDRMQAAKLVIASNPCGCETHLVMPMSDAVTFIRDRFRKYRDVKAPDRLFFNDELIQFLASRDDGG